MLSSVSRMATVSIYRTTRDLHPYVGHFVSPFVLVHAASALLLNHAWRRRACAMAAWLPRRADSKRAAGALALGVVCRAFFPLGWHALPA